MALAQQRIYTIDDIYALPEGQRAELINGQMYMMAPPNRQHQKILNGTMPSIIILLLKKAPVRSILPHLRYFSMETMKITWSRI